MNRNPARRLAETSSLMGVLEFRPRLAVALAILTLTVAVVGWRFTRDAGVRRVDGLARDAVKLFAAAPDPGTVPGAPLDPAEAERKVHDISAVALELPRDEPGFAVERVRREQVGRQTAAAVRFRYAGDVFLLLAFRQDRLLGDRPPAAFPEESFLSGEREGKSFVFWERDGALYIVVSDVDVTRAFDLVRRFFT
ncbi:MAG: hypothetical protein H6Q80_2001 [Deltaproteobacteria bacterium]|jgi:hypothetical protein|nr:hypothetical protein [Deltaproteobacteria bacterium]